VILTVVLVLCALGAGWWIRARWDRAGRAVDRLAKLDSDPVCPACRQPVRPDATQLKHRNRRAVI
jgi:hypothetical protein